MRLYDVQIFIVDWAGFITAIVFISLFIGLIQSEPLYFVQGIFLFKLFISLFLIYRFNKFRKKVIFTELDRKICYMAGVNLILISFADVIQVYTIQIKAYIRTNYYYKQIVSNILAVTK